jgi:hypothetical protein
MLKYKVNHPDYKIRISKPIKEWNQFYFFLKAKIKEVQVKQ